MNQGIHKHISLTWSRVLLLIVLAITIGGVSTAYTGETADNPPPAKAQSGNMVLMKLKLDPAISWVSSMIPVGKEDLSESHIWHTAVAQIESKPEVKPEPGLYGELKVKPKTDFSPYLTLQGHEAEWENKKFAYVSTELSPAVLYHNQYAQLTLFNKIEAWGVGGPSDFAVPTQSGVTVVKRGDGVDAATMSEPWILVWFAGSKGWLFDVPWLVVLEKKPKGIRLDEQGLTIKFDGLGGRVVSMPLYGYYKVPPTGKKWSQELPGAVDFGIDTSTWATALPQAVVERCRWWSRVHRRFPVYVHETFSVDRLHETVTIRSQVEFIDIKDDWGTQPLTFSPLPPTLALALTDDHNRFPLRVSDPVTDPFIFTPQGPYMGVVGKDHYTVEFETLKYINQIEKSELPPPDAPQLAREALTRLRRVAGWRWKNDAQMPIDHGKANYVWAAAADRWYPRALPYIADPKTKANAKTSLQKYMANWVLDAKRYTAYQGGKRPYKGAYLLHGPGVGSWGELGDAGKFAENQYALIWSYAHYTGDTNLLKQRWNLIKKLDITPLEMTWKGFGRGGIAEMGDEAAPPLQFARAAYMVGDLDTYHYQSYIATRELLHLFVKQRGAQYFRKLQPYHQYFQKRIAANAIEAIPEEVYVSNLFGGLHGWQVDGPTYPKKHGERQYWNRWVRFSSPAVARFFRDHISSQDLRREFEEVAARMRKDNNRTKDPKFNPLAWDDAHILPSLVRLFSLTLNPAPSLEEIENMTQVHGRRAKFHRWRLYPDSSAIAASISVMRLSHPTRYERIIPKSGKPSPFVLGLERSIRSGWAVLIQDIKTSYKKTKESQAVLTWPVIAWTNWQPPTRAPELPAGNRFSFGMVTPLPGTQPKQSGGWVNLNWNSYSRWMD